MINVPFGLHFRTKCRCLMFVCFLFFTIFNIVYFANIDPYFLGSDLRAKYQSIVVQPVQLRSKICNCSFSTAIFLFVTICNIISLAKIDQYPVAFAFRATYLSLKFFGLEIYFILFLRKIIVDLETDCDSSNLCKVNIDAFISYPLKELTIMPKTLLKLSLSPNWKHAWTPLDFGYFTFCGERDSVKNYPHTLLLEAFSEAYMHIHVLFPNMKKMKLGVRIPEGMLGTDAQKTFTDRLLIPTIRRALICSRANRSGGSYGEAIGKSRFGPISPFCFCAFFLRGKSPMYGPDYTSILDTMVDWPQLDHQRWLVDIGLNLFAESEDGRPLVSYVKEEKVESIGKRFGDPSIKTDFYGMSLGSFGGFSGKGRSGSLLTPSKVMIYNYIKYPFTTSHPGVNENVSGPWIPEEMRNTFRHQEGHHLKNMFTTRLEVRVSAADVGDILVRKLMDGLHRLQSNGAFIHFFVDEYLAYVRELLNLTSEMMVSLSRDVQLPAVSGFAFCVFLLNSLMHPADKGSTCCNNFVKTHRCKKNYLFFMSYHFVFDLNEWRFIDAFDSTRMADMFPGLSFVRTLVVDGDRLVNEIDRMAAANEINPENVHLAHDVALNNTVSYTVSLGPLTFAPCLRFSKTPLSRHRVPGTWLTNQAIPMFDVGNADTVRYAEKTRQIFHRFGLGPESAVRFLEVVFEEYFSLVGGGHTGCNIENLSFGGDQSMFDPELRDALDLTVKMDFLRRVAFLLRYVEQEHRERAWVQSLVTDDRMDRSWKAFGSRSVFLELFLHADISSRSLKHLHCILLAASVYILEYVPMSCPTKMFRRTSSTTIATRKVSWFLETMGDVSREMFQFLQDYAYDHKFEDPSFPRVYRRVTEIHGSRVGGRTIPRVRARKHRRNGRLI
ncbi:uncharacterized protein EV154DRAFT_586134 [Mucor mucedo]|uniref:uncharacterized protein n=1 Tax=Mucor mucedo TaxID=29922 RepID=UPI00221F7E4B|nr:uncharacterized protein EV154DRAFT_586134 [Mucor mucedo]KAI7863927.1 hypothetical protein EV154DRAFT_586134 [Mucor mucedo]